MHERRPVWMIAPLILAACASVPSAYEQTKTQINSEMATAVEQSAPIAKDTVVSPVSSYPTMKMELPASVVKANEPRFDVIVSNTPLRQVLLGIVADTPYSLLLPNDLDGNITVNLKNVTVTEAFEALKHISNYDYQLVGKRIIVQSQGLQTRVMKINYLNAIRRSGSNIRVLSGSISDANTSSSNNSNNTNNSSNSNNQNSNSQQTAFVTSQISTSVQSDFWGELLQSIKMILGQGEGRNVMVSPQSGVVVVRAMPYELAQVEAFLKASQLSLERQVIIEAKIMEVTLGNEFQAGINWAAFGNNRNYQVSAGQLNPGVSISSSGAINTSPISGTASVSLGNAVGAAGSMFGMVLRTSDFAAALNLLEEQGKVHVLSSPRVATLNNQSAVLKVGTDDYFVTGVDTVVTSSATGTTVTPKVNLQPFFSGIALDVTPQIDEDSQITLHVHPMISDVSTRTQTLNIGSDQYTFPTASSQISEMDSMVKAQNGQMIALGGLIRQRAINTDSQIPFLGGIPVFGNLFKQKSQEMQKRELVILLKTTIVDADSAWQDDISQSEARMRSLLETNNATPFKRKRVN